MQQDVKEAQSASSTPVAPPTDYEHPKIWRSRDDVQRIIRGKIESDYDSLRGCPGFCHDPLQWDEAKALVEVCNPPPPSIHLRPRNIDPCQLQPPPCAHSFVPRLALLMELACQEGTDESLGKMGRTPAHVAVYWDYRSEVRRWQTLISPMFQTDVPTRRLVLQAGGQHVNSPHNPVTKCASERMGWVQGQGRA